jgi:hypothetical protein
MGSHKLVTGGEYEFTALKTKQMALLDTGAELSLVGGNAYQLFLYKEIPLVALVGSRAISTRLGRFEGMLYRV